MSQESTRVSKLQSDDSETLHYVERTVQLQRFRFQLVTERGTTTSRTLPSVAKLSWKDPGVVKK